MSIPRRPRDRRSHPPRAGARPGIPVDVAPERAIEGARPVLEALRAGRRALLEIWCPDAAAGEVFAEIRTRAAAAGVTVHGVAHAGDVRALAEPYPESRFEDLLARAARPLLFLALDQVTDVGNLGAIARSVETAGGQGLIVEHRRSPAIGPGPLRASAGALEHLALARVPSLKRALELAKGEGVAILVADAAGTPLAGLPSECLRGDLVWVMGAEDRGVRPSVRALADATVAIPCRGRIQSLNVAAAAAYLLHRTAEIRGV